MLVLGQPFPLRHGETVQLFSNLGHIHLYLLDWDPHTAVYPASLRLNPGTRFHIANYREMERGSRHAPPGWRDEVQPYLRHVGSWMDVERSTALLKHLCRLACRMAGASLPDAQDRGMRDEGGMTLAGDSVPPPA